MTVMLDITADDVVHSWWIPELGGKMDAVPGLHQQDLVQGRPKAGVFDGQCAELCGRNHANMYARVIGVPFDEYQAWYDREAGGHQGRPRRGAPSSAQRLDKQSDDPGPVGSLPRTDMAITTDTEHDRPRAAARRGRRSSPTRARPEADGLDVVDHHDRSQEDRDHVPRARSLVFFLLGGVEALLMRIQLGVAGQHAS